MPLDEEMWRMRRMPRINDQAKKHKKQARPVRRPGMATRTSATTRTSEPDEL